MLLTLHLISGAKLCAVGHGGSMKVKNSSLVFTAAGEKVAKHFFFFFFIFYENFQLVLLCLLGTLYYC